MGTEGSRGKAPGEIGYRGVEAPDYIEIEGKGWAGEAGVAGPRRPTTWEESLWRELHMSVRIWGWWPRSAACDARTCRNVTLSGPYGPYWSDYVRACFLDQPRKQTGDDHTMDNNNPIKVTQEQRLIKLHY